MSDHDSVLDSVVSFFATPTEECTPWRHIKGIPPEHGIPEVAVRINASGPTLSDDSPAIVEAVSQRFFKHTWDYFARQRGSAFRHQYSDSDFRTWDAKRAWVLSTFSAVAVRGFTTKAGDVVTVVGVEIAGWQ